MHGRWSNGSTYPQRPPQDTRRRKARHMSILSPRRHKRQQQNASRRVRKLARWLRQVTERRKFRTCLSPSLRSNHDRGALGLHLTNKRPRDISGNGSVNTRSSHNDRRANLADRQRGERTSVERRSPSNRRRRMSRRCRRRCRDTSGWRYRHCASCRVRSVDPQIQHRTRDRHRSSHGRPTY